MEVKLHKIKIKKGDMVMIRSGKYRGRTGKVTAVHPKTNKVSVEGINIVKRHRKPTTLHPQGGIIELTKPIWVSKVGLLDSAAKKAARVGFKLGKDGNKSRVLKTSGKEVK